MHRDLVAALILMVGGCGLASAQAQTPAPSQVPVAPDDAAGDTQGHTAPAAALSGGYLVPEGEDDQSDATWTALHPIVPAMVGGYTTSMAFGSEVERANHIRGGVTVQSTYDDNPFATSGASSAGLPDSNYAVSIFPQISLDQVRSRLRWVMNYAGGFTFNQRLTSQNQTSQAFNFDLQYRVSPHVSVRATESLKLTTGLFGPVASLSGAVPSAPEGTNPFVLTPLAKEFATTTRGEIDYQFTGSDIVGASGGFDSLQYRDLMPGDFLLDTRDESISGYYMHRLSASNWLGGSYQFQHLGYPGTVNDTLVHSIIGFDTWQIRRSITISIFGGPQYSNDQFPGTAIPIETLHQTMWSAAGGSSVSWTGHHTSATGSFTHSVSDGGGLQGSVQQNSVNGSFRRQLTRQTVINFTGGYATNNALSSTTSGVQSANYFTAGVNVTRQIGQHCFVQGAYSRQSQQTTGVTTFGNDVQRDQVMASFSYQFSRPWGQ